MARVPCRQETRFLALVAIILLIATARLDASWWRHTIDADSRGADGVRLLDVNGDGMLDIVTPWEEGGVIRVAIHPGRRVKSPWPTVTIGKVRSPEDAVLVDLDGDGAQDVVSSCEGKTRTMYVHWGPSQADRFRDPEAWTTEAIPATAGKQMWMFAAPMDIDGRYGLDLAVGSKGASGSIGWLEVPRNARDLQSWKFHSLRKSGWIMSLVPHDMDGDGDLDIVASDRKGGRRGVLWLENPGPRAATRPLAWTEHMLGGQRHEVMFLDIRDLDSDGRHDVLVATRNSQMLLFRRTGIKSTQWTQLAIPNPFDVPYGKAVRVGDIDLDGRPDIVHTANTKGDRLKPGVTWMKLEGTDVAGPWKAFDVSRDEGVKFDLVQLTDIDRDGDLDILTCEERDGLGVFWYENPTR